MRRPNAAIITVHRWRQKLKHKAKFDKALEAAQHARRMIARKSTAQDYLVDEEEKFRTRQQLRCAVDVEGTTGGEGSRRKFADVGSRVGRRYWG